MMRHVRQWMALAALTFLSLNPALAYSADSVLTVNPSIPISGTNFHTIQAAIDTLPDTGLNVTYTEIRISPGTYVENVQLELQNSGVNLESRNYDLNETIPNNTFFRGLQINGDIRPCFPQYQNGYELAANSNISQVYTLTTDVPGVGPYPVLVSSEFGTQPMTDTGPLPAQLSNPITGNPLPITNNFAGGFAVMDRGAIGFATKAHRAQDAGAGAVIIVNNQPIGTVDLAGTDPAVVIPVFSISQAFGTTLKTAITNNPGILITVAPPASFYNPPIGTNYGLVSLRHPGGDLTKIQVTISYPLPAVDPNLQRGTIPPLEQPIFDDPRLALVPGDQIILAESDILGDFSINNGLLPRQVFEVASLSGNVITLTSAVDPTVIDITKLGSSLTFLPNVQIIPELPRMPVFTAQTAGFSMSGIWIDTSPDLAFAATLTGLELGGVQALLSNIIVTDSNGTSANGFAFDINAGSTVEILDGWRDSVKNRRLSSIGWSSGVSITGKSDLSGPIVFNTAAKNLSLFTSSDFSDTRLDCLILMGNIGLYQAVGATGLIIGNYGAVSTSALLTVTDIFGGGIAGGVTCDSFRLERIYKPSGGSVRANALQVNDGTVFEVTSYELYADDGSRTQSIRTSSIIKDCYDVDPLAIFSSGTVPNVGIFVDDEAVFVSYKDLEFSNNSLDYLTMRDDQMITPGWEKTPHNIFQIRHSGPLNPNYVWQEIRSKNTHLTLDPAETFEFRGVYADKQNLSKSFNITSKRPTWHYLTLTSGHFLGTKYKTLRFNPHKDASVTLKVINRHTVQVTGMNEVEYFYD